MTGEAAPPVLSDQTSAGIKGTASSETDNQVHRTRWVVLRAYASAHNGYGGCARCEMQ